MAASHVQSSAAQESILGTYFEVCKAGETARVSDGSRGQQEEGEEKEMSKRNHGSPTLIRVIIGGTSAQ